MKSPLLWLAACAVSAMVGSGLCAIVPARAAATYVTFDVAGAAGGTFPSAINAGGAVTGGFVDARGNTHGFLRKPDGTVEIFDVPKALSTLPRAINDAGTIAGFYAIDQANTAAFVRSPNGKLTAFAFPGNTVDTGADSINAGGTIVGEYENFSTYDDYAFVRTPKGKFKKFSAQKDDELVPCCIDNENTIAGTQFLYDQVHGFLRDPEGAIITFDVPGTSGGTEVTARSETGWIAGNYVFAKRREIFIHGFERGPDGAFVMFQFSDRGDTQPCCVDTHGTVAGSYNLEPREPSHGFMLTSDGAITTFQVPNQTRGTFPTAMNETDLIAGYYVDASGTHGFLRTP